MPLANLLYHDLTGPLVRGVGEGGVNAAWAGALPALRTFVTANYNQPNPHNQTVMASPPTISYLAGSTPPTGLTNSFRYADGASALTYYGGDDFLYATQFRRFPNATVGASGGNVSGGRNASTWRVTAVCNAQKVAFRVLGNASPAFTYRFIVDGQYVSATASSAVDASTYFTLDFGTKASRRVTVEGEAAAAFCAIHVAVGDTVTAVPGGALRMIALGDSFTDAIGATARGDGLCVVAADLLGIANVWQSGVGGSGYVNTVGGTKYKLSQRLADANSYGPWDVITVEMGINDIGTTAATITSEAAACFASLRANNPRAQIFVVGPWDVNAPAAPVTNYAACKAAIQAAIPAGAGFTFLDPQGVSYTKFDSTHPDTAGHATLGAWKASAIKTAIGA